MTMTRPEVLVAHQPAYLPWPGYLSRLLDVDTLVLLDHVQFAERGRQHRNLIRGSGGVPQRLTVPVLHRFGQRICEVRVAGTAWAAAHWRALTCAYGKAAYFADYPLRAVYEHHWERLTEVNQAVLDVLLDGFGIKVHCVRSSSIAPEGSGTHMLADLARRLGRNVLRVGTGATRYLDHAVLAEAGIAVEVATYDPPDGLAVSAVDLLMRHGPAARTILEQHGRVTAVTA
ncbi:hypothetical protein DP939_22185 [Spongiactinospora rosea]|uniref:WbqC-like protein n=1 Tax=Spongiactinospora rosea TaxID=2248750 RepID=A0A366LXP5_9ACTN|nr:WbqC family protein [Spongiactinospora rosea]RBQ18074.1 hypothetical protein DP939_22185 [Spongiactinospora rosea]